MQVIQEWRLYIVQEFCDGGSLRQAIESRSFLNPATGSPQLEWVLQMAREVAAGMVYLHEHNIIHGDLVGWRQGLPTYPGCKGRGGGGGRHR